MVPIILKLNALCERMGDKNSTYVTCMYRFVRYLYVQGEPAFFRIQTVFQPVFCILSCFIIEPCGVFPSSPVSVLALVTLSVFECFQKAWNIIIKQSCVPINVNS